ncbi:MAG: 2-dehydropantoate 2-reductase N-terminal domain-containing protein, partial [Burkholderiales bacterium]
MERNLSKRIVVVGAGAIGGYAGAYMSRAGHDVTLVDAWADQINAINAHGIHATGPHDPIEARPKAVHLI